MTHPTPEAALAFAQAAGNLYRGGPANVSWERALEGLSAQDAARRPEALPHSVAQLVAHVQYWQAFLLRGLAGQSPTMPAHASGGWPEPGEWEALREALLRDAERLRELTRDPRHSAEPDPQGRPAAASLTNFAAHGVYHLGQVVAVRQALGLWPPPSGGDTW